MLCRAAGVPCEAILRVAATKTGVKPTHFQLYNCNAAASLEEPFQNHQNHGVGYRDKQIINDPLLQLFNIQLSKSFLELSCGANPYNEHLMGDM